MTYAQMPEPVRPPMPPMPPPKPPGTDLPGPDAPDIGFPLPGETPIGPVDQPPLM